MPLSIADTHPGNFAAVEATSINLRRYRGARGRDWLKVKCRGREEFIVLGWTPPEGSRSGLGALKLGVRDGDGRLHYVGGVGTGLTEAELRALCRKPSPLASTPPTDL